MDDLSKSAPPTGPTGWRSPYAAGANHADGSVMLGVATRTQRIIAAAAVGLMTLATIAVLPIASHIGPALAGFVPSYQMTVFLLYAISALHLIAYFRRTRIIPLLHIAGGCLFSALMLIIQLFSFRIWGPDQLVGSTPATTSWLWVFWHLGPAACAISYVFALRPGAKLIDTRSSPYPAMLAMLAVCALATAAATAISTWGAPYLPIIVNGDDYSALITSFVGPCTLALTASALVLLVWRTRCATTVELFLAVSLALLLLDDLPTLIGGSRLSVGWYFGRLEAAISAAMLLGFYIADADRRFAAVSTLASNLATERSALDRMVTEQSHANEALGLLARQDALTGLANRRRLDELIEQEWFRARREQQSLALLMIDVDHFKLYNDRYGHQAGDACLRTIAFLLRDIARRPADLAARYGGEEFILLLPNTDLQGAGGIAEAFRAALRWKHIPHDRAPLRRVTVSIGVAAMVPAPDNDDFESLIKAADQALYRAKESGRDKAMAPGMDL